MSPIVPRLHRTVLVGLALVCASLTAQAGKPEWVEQGKPGKSHSKDDHGAKERRDDDRRDDRSHATRDASRSGVSVQIQIGGFFNDDQRQATRTYYEPRERSGKCPPGLAKKNNGCMPPGQAKKWRRGESLPPAVVYYPVPSEVQIRLGVPPAGYKFVRVAADILLIAVGTGMVIDAIEDLGKL
jgi:Ni/Co efflux regulator RcnB